MTLARFVANPKLAASLQRVPPQNSTQFPVARSQRPAQSRSLSHGPEPAGNNAAQVRSRKLHWMLAIQNNAFGQSSPT